MICNTKMILKAIKANSGIVINPAQLIKVVVQEIPFEQGEALAGIIL